jgi:hypothetical protein
LKTALRTRIERRALGSIFCRCFGTAGDQCDKRGR